MPSSAEAFLLPPPPLPAPPLLHQPLSCRPRKTEMMSIRWWRHGSGGRPGARRCGSRRLSPVEKIRGPWRQTGFPIELRGGELQHKHSSCTFEGIVPTEQNRSKRQWRSSALLQSLVLYSTHSSNGMIWGDDTSRTTPVCFYRDQDTRWVPQLQF